MQRTESEILEFKESFGLWQEIIQALCGFANKNGGTVIVGFNNNGEPTNLQIGKNTIEEFVNKVKLNTDPVLYPSVNIKTFALGEIVEISIPKSDNKPVFAFGRAYIRVGKNTLQLSATEIRELAKKYQIQEYDKLQIETAIENIDFDEKLINLLNKNFFKLLETNSIIDILNDLSLIKNNKLLNAGYLCFAKENKLFPNATIKVARFKGDKALHFIDMKTINSNIINATDEIINFIKRHINMEVVITGAPQHLDKWDYPLPAIREAVINAIVHRDYNDAGNIQIRIFDNSIEIWSPGYLPKEIDIYNLEQTNRSIPRNKLIADIFFKINYIEQWGTGLLKIIQYCKDFGIKSPLFLSIQGAFVIRIFKKVSIEKLNSELNEGISDRVKEKVMVYEGISKGIKVDEGINKGVSEGIKVSEGINKGISEGIKVNEGISEGINIKVNEGINLLFTIIKENQGKRSFELAKIMNKPQKTIERWLGILKENKKIVFMGSNKTGGYYIAEK